jgi:hypothetical protein
MRDVREGCEEVTAGEVECCMRCAFLARKYGLVLAELRPAHFVFRAEHRDGSLGEDP